jgi:hypothetical protein
MTYYSEVPLSFGRLLTPSKAYNGLIQKLGSHAAGNHSIRDPIQRRGPHSPPLFITQLQSHNRHCTFSYECDDMTFTSVCCLRTFAKLGITLSTQVVN